MSHDHVFGMSLWERLGLRKWFPDEYPHVYPQRIILPQNPDFPSEAKDYAGALLFDSNAWIEEQHFCSPLPVAQPSDHKTVTREAFLLKSCMPLPVEEVVFRPICPVIQHQPRIEVSGIVTAIPPEQSMLDRSIDFIHAKPVAFVSIIELLFLMILLFWLPTKAQSSTVDESEKLLDSTAQALGPSQTEGETLSTAAANVATRLRKQVGLNSFSQAMFRAAQRENEALTSQSRQQKVVTGIYHKLYQCFRHGYVHLRERHSELEGLVKTLKAEKVSLEKAKKDLRQELAEKHLEAEERNEENTTVNSQKIQLAEDLEVKCKELDDFQRAQTSAEANLQEKIGKLNKAANTHVDSLAVLQCSYDRSRKEIDELQGIKNLMEANLQKNTDQLNNDAKTHIETVTELQSSIDQSNKEIAELDSKPGRKQDEIAGLNQKVLALKDEHARGLEDKDKEIASLKEQLRLTGAEIQGSREAEIETEKEAKTLRENLISQSNDAEQEKQRLRLYNQELEAKLRHKGTELEANEATIARLANEKEALNAEKDSALNDQKTTIDRLTKANEDLVEDLKKVKQERAIANEAIIENELKVEKSSNVNAEQEAEFAEKNGRIQKSEKKVRDVEMEDTTIAADVQSQGKQPTPQVTTTTQSTRQKSHIFQSFDELVKKGDATDPSDILKSKWATPAANTPHSPRPSTMASLSSPRVPKQEVEKVEAPIVPKSMEKNAPPSLAPKGPRMLRDKPTGPEIAYKRAAKAQSVGAGSSQPALAREAAVAFPLPGKSVEAPPTIISPATTPTSASPTAALMTGAIATGQATRPQQSVSPQGVQGSKYANAPDEPAPAPRRNNEKKKVRHLKTEEPNLGPGDYPKPTRQKAPQSKLLRNEYGYIILEDKK